MREQVVAYMGGLQDRICAGLEPADGGATFREDRWDRPGGGGGRTRVIADGAVFEKGGVNYSEVYGEFPPEFAKQLPGNGLKFTAVGVSLVLHPRSPLVPTVHANFRYLTHGSKAWFGGGADLTPYYPFKEDVVYFHRAWKKVCDAHPAAANYAQMKKDCDEYFFLKHRNEARGVGGIFFDYMDATDAAFAFVRTAGDAFLGAYLPIVEPPKGAFLHAGAAALPGVPPGAVCRVQLGVRPGDGVRAKDRRPDREHPDEPPAGRAVRVRLPTGDRVAGGGTDRILAQAEGLGGDGGVRSSHAAPASSAGWKLRYSRTSRLHTVDFREKPAARRVVVGRVCLGGAQPDHLFLKPYDARERTLQFRVVDNHVSLSTLLRLSDSGEQPRPGPVPRRVRRRDPDHGSTSMVMSGKLAN